MNLLSTSSEKIARGKKSSVARQLAAISSGKEEGCCTKSMATDVKQKMLYIRLEETGGGKVIPASIAMEHLPWPVLRIDTQLRYLNGNASSASLAGSHHTTAAGRSLSEIDWPPSACLAIARAVAGMNANPVAHNLNLAWQSNEGRCHFNADLLPELDEQGRLASVLILMRKASEHQKQSDEYEKSQAALEARDAFFGWVSHELRSPLNGIQSWTHILETYVSLSSDSALAARAMKGIRNGVAQQLRLIEEILDMSRIIEGKPHISRHAFSLKPITHTVIEGMRSAASARQVDIEVAPLLKQDLMENDPFRVQQCMKLLLSYAIYRTDPHSALRITICADNEHAQFRVNYLCTQGSERAGKSGAAHALSSSSRPVSRGEMDMLLARCLAVLLSGRLETTINGSQVTHTLALPLRQIGTEPG